MDRYIGLMIDMIIHSTHILAFYSYLPVLTTALQYIHQGVPHVLSHFLYPRYIQDMCSQEYHSLQTNIAAIYQSYLV